MYRVKPIMNVKLGQYQQKSEKVQSIVSIQICKRVLICHHTNIQIS